MIDCVRIISYSNAEINASKKIPHSNSRCPVAKSQSVTSSIWFCHFLWVSRITTQHSGQDGSTTGHGLYSLSAFSSHFLIESKGNRVRGHNILQVALDTMKEEQIDLPFKKEYSQVTFFIFQQMPSLNFPAFSELDIPQLQQSSFSAKDCKHSGRFRFTTNNL